MPQVRLLLNAWLPRLSEMEYRKEMERLGIDLSWKSSQIEGNTYSLLETELFPSAQWTPSIIKKQSWCSMIRIISQPSSAYSSSSFSLPSKPIFNRFYTVCVDVLYYWFQREIHRNSFFSTIVLLVLFVKIFFWRSKELKTILSAYLLHLTLTLCY